MNTLLYDYNVCHVRRGDQTFSAGIKPELSFEYEALDYRGGFGGYRWNNSDHELTPEQVDEIEAYIQAVAADPTEQAIADAYVYLAQTDWVVTKISEAQALGDDVSGMLIKYSAEIQKRKEARATINGQ